jgi:hypothetical protein
MNGSTGGGVVAPAWKAFMTAVHTSADIPPIPGLPLHPNQEAEQARLAAMQASEPQPEKNKSGISDATRAVLQDIASQLKRAGGIADSTPPAASGDKKAAVEDGAETIPASLAQLGE